ncbi:MAG: DUF2155 domain-containing protein [Alphaproteobacteria bacterium]|nr:DUF2155 domain-containing protein [Alphaproteobacteria bacterium]
MRPLWMLCCAGLAVSAGAAFAQGLTATQAIDQSLFYSEPVEEEVSPEAAAPAPPAAKNPQASASEPQPEYNVALLQGLKKVTAETVVFEAPVDGPVAFGTLTVTVKKCTKSRPEDRPDNAALLSIEDKKPDGDSVTAFSGWIFSSSPSISALEHPVYDITMLDCLVKPTARDPHPPRR